MTRTAGVSALERLEAIIAGDELFRLAELVPEPDPTRGGRPRLYPAYMWLLYDALLSVYGSARRVEAELAHPLIWAHICELIRTRFPDDPMKWLPDEPMRRHHYLYGRTVWLTRPEVLETLRESHRILAVVDARQLGLLDPNGSGSWTHPDLSRMVYADGKVVTPLFRHTSESRTVDRSTGEVRQPRFEPDAALHFEGTGETAWGTKWAIAAVRSNQVHGRVILDVDWVPTPGGEASTVMGIFAELAPLAPGAQGVLYDTALRGVHHQRLLRDLGWLPVNRVSAASSPGPRRGYGTRTEKSAFIEQRTVTGPDGPTTIDLFARGGAVGIVTVTATGERIFTPLRRVRTTRTADKGGSYRWYNHYRLPDYLGGTDLVVRLHGNDDDRRRKFNRTENVRPIPPGDDDFARLYRRRNDAESINRAIDDTLWLRRAHSIGHARQHLNLLTHALGVNALAVHRHRRTADPPTARAA